MKLKNLLVIDDDPAYRGLCASALGAEYSVSCAEGGEEGVESCRRTLPDVVLLDLRMPRVDGLSVLRALAADPATSGVPVVVFSASWLDAATRAALDGLVNVRGRLDKLDRLTRVREALLAARGAN